MVPDDLHDFFVASAGVGGALIGLLFVALSVSSERFAKGSSSAPIHRVGAAAALTAFTNALAISLFGLIPGQEIGGVAVAFACAGLVFVLASLLSLIRQRVLWSRRVLDAIFLVGLVVTFVYQLIRGLEANKHPDEINSLAVLVVVCFLIGVSRAWALIGGPSFGFAHEVTALVRKPDGQDRPPRHNPAG